MNDNISFDINVLKQYVSENSVEEIMIMGLQKIVKSESVDLSLLTSQYTDMKYDELLGNIEYFREHISDIKYNWEHYEKTYLLLKDYISKKTFLGMLYAKIYMNPQYIENVYSNEIPYFDEKIWGKFGSECYVDCGGYTGDTVLKFISICPQYSKIYVFEAIPEIAAKCRKKIRKINEIDNDVIVYENAVADSEKTLKFSLESMTGDSKISAGGDFSVNAVSLDNTIKNAVSFIKMDIEGSEKDAIEGAKKIIEKYTPKMAICIYHLKDDFWRIIELIRGINNGYEYAIRQHTPEVYAETVLYCIPKNTSIQESGINTVDVIEKAEIARENLFFYSDDENLNHLRHMKDKFWFFEQLYFKDKKINVLEKFEKELNESKAWLSEQCKYKDIRISELEAWINELEKGKNWLEQQNESLETQFKAEQKTNQELNKENHRLQNENSKYRYKLDILKGDPWIQKIIKHKKYIV